MTIDPTTLPEGTIVSLHDNWFGRVEETDASDEITATLVKVPDGMTVEDAQQALTEHVAWVPLPDGPTEAQVGKRLRCEDPEYRFAFEIVPSQVIPRGSRNEGMVWGGGGMAYSITAKAKGRLWFIHPDDVPTDPDAELIEAMAAGMWKDDVVRWEDGSPSTRGVFLTYAERALAVVREHEATR